MGDASAYAGYGRRILRVVVVGLLALSVAAAASLASSEGLTPSVIGTVVVTLYVAGLVAYGVFYEAMETRRFRLALYVGVVLWGAEGLLVGDGSALNYVLLLGGAALFVREWYRTG